MIWFVNSEQTVVEGVAPSERISLKLEYRLAKKSERDEIYQFSKNSLSLKSLVLIDNFNNMLHPAALGDLW